MLPRFAGCWLQAQHDVRASLALFEKSLNIPAVHAAEPFTIPAVKPAPLAAMPQPQPQLHAAELLRPSGADSMQGSQHQRGQLKLCTPAAAV